jgi:hypothetical protein
MVWSLFLGIFFDFIWGYFLCVTTRYATCKDGAPKPIDYTGGMGDKMGAMTGGDDKKDDKADAKDEAA